MKEKLSYCFYLTLNIILGVKKIPILGFSFSKIAKTYDKIPDMMIDTKSNIVIAWSAKCASTFVMKWFFYQKEQLSKALSYHSWIHKYFEEVYLKSSNYQKNMFRFNFFKSNYRCFKIIRNPYARAVSSYIHFVKTGYNAHDKTIIYHGLGKSKNIDLSFVEFLEAHILIPTEQFNIHMQPQTNELDDILKFNYIKLEDLEGEISKIEKEHSLKPSNFKQLSRSHHRQQYQEEIKTTKSTANTAYTKALIHAQTPHWKSFLDKDTIEMINEIYAQDFRLLAYPLFSSYS